MLDFSLTLQMNTGIVAAIIFFVFEIIIFPITLYATSMVAAISLQNRVESGQTVTVKSIVFPLWGEGLLNGQVTHWILLLFRVIIIAIPVYLETRLKGIEKPLFETVTLPHTFEVNPVTDWTIYQNTSNDAIVILRENAEEIFSTCTRFNSEEWLIASVANITYLKNRKIGSILCVNGTEKPVYKRIRTVPDYAEQSSAMGLPPSVRRNFTIDVSISYGSKDSFPPTPSLDRRSITDYVFRVQSVTVRGKSEIECFTENIFMVLRNLSSLVMTFMCHNITGSVVDFLTVGTVALDFSNHATYPFENGTVYNTSSVLEISLLYLVGQLKFPEDPIFTAEHVINVDFLTTTPVDSADFEGKVRRLLYTKKDNRTTSVGLDETISATILDSVVLTAFLLEIAIVVVAGIIMFLIGRSKIRFQQIPTTLNGLSRCWVYNHAPVNMNHSGYVCLKLDHRSSDERGSSYPHLNGKDDDDIFSHIGTRKFSSDSEE